MYEKPMWRISTHAALLWDETEKSSQHAKFSGKKMEYFDPEINESYVPYVIETSIGVDRMFLSVLCSAYKEEQLEGNKM